MRILLIAVNAKYIHSNLAVHSLASYAAKKMKYDRTCFEIPEIEIAEYTINQPMGKILSDIYRREPDLILLSCYIWNKREIEGLTFDIRKIMPLKHLWIGGPEVSFDAENVLDSMPAVKGVICGEGEETFYRLAKVYGRETECDKLDKDLADLEGIVFRNDEGEIISCEGKAPINLSDVPFPYENLSDFSNRIIYYESSRGCPFRCSYCLSSVEKSLRFRDLKLVKKELGHFLKNKVPQVKFIDRTFNCDHRHSTEIWDFLREHDNAITNFHFEIAGDILTDDELSLLESMRPGQIQLEIGVQSTNERTLDEINRPMDFKRLRQVIGRIKSSGNIHLHLDLIAGLPFEDYNSFAESFNDVFSLEPHQLQLGFLKVLKGSPIEKGVSKYGMKYTEYPPYEILETKWISYDELIKLKTIEEMVEVYYNSGQFMNTLKFILQYTESPFRLFEALAMWYEEKRLEMLNFSRNRRYEKLLEFGYEYVPQENTDMLQKAMIYDYYSRENVKTRPAFLGKDSVEKDFSKVFYSRESREHRYLSGGRYDTDDPRLLRKLTHLEKIDDRYYLFDYTKRNPMNNNAKITEIMK